MVEIKLGDSSLPLTYDGVADLYPYVSLQNELDDNERYCGWLVEIVRVSASAARRLLLEAWLWHLDISQKPPKQYLG